MDVDAIKLLPEDEELSLGCGVLWRFFWECARAARITGLTASYAPKVERVIQALQQKMPHW